MISDETLEFLREHDPVLWRELTRQPETLPAPKVNGPRITMIDARRIVLALFPQPPQVDDDDVIDGEWRRVR